MTDRYERRNQVPHLGGKTAVILFVFTLLAFVAESQLTQYVEINLSYHQPFFLFYVVHSSFLIIFPLHILYLVVFTGASARTLLSGLTYSIKSHLGAGGHNAQHSPFPTYRLSRLVLLLTAGVTVPGLLWFAAANLAPISDVTAIWNTNAFFAYIFTVQFFKLEWERRKLFAVLLATIGVAAVIYGGSKEPPVSESQSEARQEYSQTKIFSAPFVGDALTLVAAVGYGLYQVLYKRFAALPSDPEFESSDAYAHLSVDDALSDDIDDIPEEAAASYPPPFGFHPNFLTSAIGFCTLALCWILLPIMHFLGVETFRLPENAHTVLSIAAIAFSGVIFNSGFMVLLGVWGPIITSVGNLLTIVLVYLSDIVFGKAADVVTIWSMMGAGGIVLAFGILAYDMVQRR
ncbi:hypothetical protein DENSPDRAFT_837527 [Dentipellis sp. KUC8613]|nr:hypothetical protein DENSPDRAFT_837527 [Dentipellis sp. KUC8613]